MGSKPFGSILTAICREVDYDSQEYRISNWLLKPGHYSKEEYPITATSSHIDNLTFISYVPQL